MVKVPRNYHVVKSPGGREGRIGWLMVYCNANPDPDPERLWKKAYIFLLNPARSVDTSCSLSFCARYRPILDNGATLCCNCTDHFCPVYHSLPKCQGHCASDMEDNNKKYIVFLSQFFSAAGGLPCRRENDAHTTLCHSVCMNSQTRFYTHRPMLYKQNNLIQ